MSSLAAISLNLKGSACTEQALAFDNPENALLEPVWIPRSQIRNMDHVLGEFPDGMGWGVQGMVEIELPTWLVEDKGLDAYAEECEE